MVEARFGARPPSVLIMGGLSFTPTASQAFDGVIPPWVVLAGQSFLAGPFRLRDTTILPAVQFSISGTIERKTAPPPSSSVYTLRLFASGPFKPNRGIEIPFPWPAGQPAINVAGSLSVPSGYNNFSWAQFSPWGTNYRDCSWTVIG